jgi:hypothetical protein
MSKGVELVLITKQEILVSPRAKPTVAKHVHIVVKVRYTEFKFY